MKLWIDDVRPAPEGYVWCKSVNEAKMKVVESIYLRTGYIQRVAYANAVTRTSLLW